MTNEEKAKAYDKALQKAKYLHEAAANGRYDIEVKTFECIFPELKESEDDRIRKALIEYFKRYREIGTCGSETFSGIPTDNILAWLEKQGKSKWTEEDDTIRCEIIRRMEALDHYWNRPNDQKLIDWLKSLKQRMEEQQ